METKGIKMKYRELKPGEVVQKGDEYLDGNHWYKSQGEGLTVKEACHPFSRKYRRPIPEKKRDGGKGGGE